MNKRWENRLESYKRALMRLEEACEANNPDDIHKDGTIKRFEFTFELAWKLLKDYAEEELAFADINSPTKAIEIGLSTKLIASADVWELMKKARNTTLHDYSEEYANKLHPDVKEQFLPALQQLAHNIKG